MRLRHYTPRIQRRFGYEPAILLEDQSKSKYEALVSLALGYQGAVERNTTSFKRFKRVLPIAIMLMVLAPLAGLTALIAAPARPQAVCPSVIPVRAASAWAECHSATDF
jgi:hypothetical protein